jgi:hypothetical protein
VSLRTKFRSIPDQLRTTPIMTMGPTPRPTRVTRQKTAAKEEEEEEAVTPSHSQPLPKKKKSVAPCTRDYVAPNGWLSIGCNRLTSGTARTPASEGLKTHAQRAPLQKERKKCDTALRRTESLARERVQQGRTGGCHQPHFKRLERDDLKSKPLPLWPECCGEFVTMRSPTATSPASPKLATTRY